MKAPPPGRGQAAALSFKEALLAGLASDGGLYVPEAWPHLNADEIRALRGRPYVEVAFAVMSPFVGGEIEDAALIKMIEEAYATFQHRAVTPLVQMGPSAPEVLLRDVGKSHMPLRSFL